TSLRAAASQARVESWLPTRYSTVAPGRALSRRRASPMGPAAGPSSTSAPPEGPRRRAVQDPGHPLLGGAPDLEQVEDVAAKGQHHLAGMVPEGVQQLAQLSRGREVVVGPGIDQVQVGDVHEPAARA